MVKPVKSYSDVSSGVFVWQYRLLVGRLCHGQLFVAHDWLKFCFNNNTDNRLRSITIGGSIWNTLGGRWKSVGPGQKVRGPRPPSLEPPLLITSWCNTLLHYWRLLFYFIKVACLRPNIPAHSDTYILNSYLLTGYRQVLHIGTMCEFGPLCTSFWC